VRIQADGVGVVLALGVERCVAAGIEHAANAAVRRGPGWRQDRRLIGASAGERRDGRAAVERCDREVVARRRRCWREGIGSRTVVDRSGHEVVGEQQGRRAVDSKLQRPTTRRGG
jgi:hypothetical protein